MGHHAMVGAKAGEPSPPKPSSLQRRWLFATTVSLATVCARLATGGDLGGALVVDAVAFGLGALTVITAARRRTGHATRACATLASHRPRPAARPRRA